MADDPSACRIRKQLRNNPSSCWYDQPSSGHRGYVVAFDHPREPALERAMPADVGPGPTIFEKTDAEVLLRDGSWVWCQVIGQRKDRNGRWCVGIRYYPNATIGESGGWYLYDPQQIRRTQGLLPVSCAR